MRRFLRLFLFHLGLAVLCMIGGSDEAYGQYQNYLSPGMEYDTMALANASFILSQAQQNAALQYIPLELDNRQRRRRTSPPAARRSPGTASPRAGQPTPATTPRDYSATDFRPRRRQSVADQFAALAHDPSHRAPLREFGQTLFNELENSPEFRRNNLTYAVGLAIGAALGIERGRELTEEESYYVLDTVPANFDHRLGCHPPDARRANCAL